MDFRPTLKAGLWPADDYAGDRALCLEFVNTISWRGKPNPTEYLPDPEAWFIWLHDNAVLPESALHSLRARARSTPDEAVAAFENALKFRESLYNLLCSDCRNRELTAKDRMTVQDILSRAMSYLKFEHGHDGWSFKLASEAPSWEFPLYGPALSAAQLLTSDFATKVRSCEREECQWLFLDLTKNHSRKWCSMQSCGNVVKARANYARKKLKSVTTNQPDNVPRA